MSYLRGDTYIWGLDPVYVWGQDGSAAMEDTGWHEHQTEKGNRVAAVTIPAEDFRLAVESYLRLHPELVGGPRET